MDDKIQLIKIYQVLTSGIIAIISESRVRDLSKEIL